MNATIRNAAGIISVAAIAVGLSVSGAAWAQQKKTVNFSIPASSTKYTQQVTIDVGDAPGHQVRVFEIQRLYKTDAPVIEGLRLKESWTRGMTDFTELSGLGMSYMTMIAENGDKIYARGNFIAQSVGKGGLRNAAVQTITGGTGKFQGIRGIVKSEIYAEPAAGINQVKSDLEYWMEK